MSLLSIADIKAGPNISFLAETQSNSHDRPKQFCDIFAGIAPSYVKRIKISVIGLLRMQYPVSYSHLTIQLFQPRKEDINFYKHLSDLITPLFHALDFGVLWIVQR
jgi:hypothetical protein